jgi:hypothetical protein
LLCGLVAFVGCSDPAPDNSCVSFCDDLCSSLEACDIQLPECRASCQGGLSPAACQGEESSDRLTCAELEQSVACAEYCSKLCNRAPTCGSFDATTCVSGCLEVDPEICNSASVEARTCAELEPELRFYDEAGRDPGVSVAGPGSSYGLCEDADDCEEPLGCSLATNTCATCETDEDCAR